MKENTLLLDVPEEKKVIDKTCRICEHRERWQCGGSTFQYCGIRKSNRTENGLLKIKCKDAACQLYKEQTNNTWVIQRKQSPAQRY